MNEEIKYSDSENAAAETVENEVPLDKNVRLMSPTRMVVRRFFRSKLSLVGLVMVIGLFLFSFVGPLFFADLPEKVEQTNPDGTLILDENGKPITTLVYHDNDGKWGEIELDESGKKEYATNTVTYTEGGVEYTLKQTTEKDLKDNFLAPPSSEHILGTDNEGYDVFVRLMYGGRISLTVSFIAVFIITIFGVILGGIAGYFGGAVDNVIMRICDILICLPGIPILLIISTLLDASDIDAKYRIYFLMVYLTLFSWPGTARLVRGQILSLREQEYVLSAKASGAKSGWIIRKHLVPNCISVIIISTALQIPSAIFTESYLSFLGLGVNAPMPSLGSLASDALNGLASYPHRLVIPAIVISLIVLSLNLFGDGLRDAFDPKLNS